MNPSPSTPSRACERGFSVIELIVSVGMILLIMTVILINNNKQRGRILLTNLAYDMALNFREVQQYGIATRETDPSSGVFDKGYGIHFQDAGTIVTYDLFVDTDGDQEMGSGESIRTVALPSGYRISQFCGGPAGSQTCSPTLTSLDISFKRPEPDAHVVGPSATYSRAEITLEYGAHTSKVTVSNTGQIAVTE